MGVMTFLRDRSWALVQHPNTLGRATAGGSADGEAETYPLEALEDVVTADFVYVRLHGDNDAHNYCYSDSELRSYAQQIDKWRRRGLDVYCFLLNDTADAAMPHDAK